MARKARKVYKANSRARFSDKEAQWIGDQIERRGGQIKPQELVELARARKSPIHNLFEWDDSTAAEAYRIEQARYHLRMIEVTIVNEGKSERMRQFIPVFIDKGKGVPPERAHVSMDRIKDTPDLARQVVEGAAKEVKLWRRRYERYDRVFGPVFKAIDKLEV